MPNRATDAGHRAFLHSFFPFLRRRGAADVRNDDAALSSRPSLGGHARSRSHRRHRHHHRHRVHAKRELPSTHTVAPHAPGMWQRLIGAMQPRRPAGIPESRDDVRHPSAQAGESKEGTADRAAASPQELEHVLEAVDLDQLLGNAGIHPSTFRSLEVAPEIPAEESSPEEESSIEQKLNVTEGMVKEEGISRTPVLAAESGVPTDIDALLRSIDLDALLPGKPLPQPAQGGMPPKSTVPVPSSAGVEKPGPPKATPRKTPWGWLNRKSRKGGDAALPESEKDSMSSVDGKEVFAQRAPTAEERRRQEEDERALKEQRERRQKEEEALRKKMLQEAAKKAPAAPPGKRQKIATRDNVFVGILNTLKHFGLGRERNEIIQNLATMLNAGLPLVDSLRTLQLETRNRAGRALIKSITDRVEAGIPLWRSMQEEHFFSPDALALVRIGEDAGSLAENMMYLSQQQEKDQALRGKVKMAMIYPSIVFVLMFIVIIGMGMFVLPNLVGVLRSLNVPLPLATRIVIWFSDTLSTHGMTIVPVSMLVVMVLAILVKYTALQGVFQWCVFRIPGIGSLMWEATVARFGVISGGLLQAGVPLVDTLRSLVEVTTIISYRKFYEKLLEHILVGDSFAKSFLVIRGSEKLLPLSVQQLVMTGERTGSLSKIMLKVAEIYERKANETAQKLPVILEPMLLLFIGALVGSIAFAIVVPIYSIVGNVSR